VIVFNVVILIQFIYIVMEEKKRAFLVYKYILDVFGIYLKLHMITTDIQTTTCISVFSCTT
jgi:hypothetical protein